jgi:small subunit ribosomal protein S15
VAGHGGVAPAEEGQLQKSCPWIHCELKVLFQPLTPPVVGGTRPMTLTKERKTELIGAHRRGTADTGSAEIQIALLTGRISHLTDHFKKHSKDFASRRGLLKMVSRRRRLLDYLKRVAPQRYLDIIRRLEIRK